jgi:hypothetical protein
VQALGVAQALQIRIRAGKSRFDFLQDLFWPGSWAIPLAINTQTVIFSYLLKKIRINAGVNDYGDF